MREIREHRVYGKEIVVEASNEAEARILVRKKSSLHIWEIKELNPGQWEAYVAKHEDCFAMND